MKYKTLILFMLVPLSIGLFAAPYIDDIYYTAEDALREAKMPKPKYKNGAKEIIYLVEDDTIAVEQSEVLAETPPTDEIEGAYLNDFVGSETDYEYANRIARFHNPKYAVMVGSPAYNDIYFLDDNDWNVCVSGSYAYITPTWTNPYYFDYMYRPFHYNGWSWLYNPYGYWSSAYSGWNYGYPFTYGFYDSYWGYNYGYNYGYNNWLYHSYRPKNSRYTNNSRRADAIQAAASSQRAATLRNPYTVVSGTQTRSVADARSGNNAATRRTTSAATAPNATRATTTRTTTSTTRSASVGSRASSYSTAPRTSAVSSRATTSGARSSSTASSSSRSSYNTTTSSRSSSYSSSFGGSRSSTSTSSGSRSSGGSYSSGGSRTSSGSRR